MISTERFRIIITQGDDDSAAEWSARHGDRIIAEAATQEALRAKLPGVVSALGAPVHAVE